MTIVKPIPEVTNDIHEYGWLVEGYENLTGKQFRYRCKRVVLATGTTDSSNHLGASGEKMYNWITHDFKELENKLDLGLISHDFTSMRKLHACQMVYEYNKNI